MQTSATPDSRRITHCSLGRERISWGITGIMIPKPITSMRTVTKMKPRAASFFFCMVTKIEKELEFLISDALIVLP
jgi:hypothetical protein